MKISVCLKCYIKHGLPADPAEFSDLMTLPAMTSHPSIRKSPAKICIFQKAHWHCIKCGISNSLIFWLGGYDYKYKDVI